MKKFGSILLTILILIFSYIAYEFISYRVKNAVSDAAFVRSDSLLTLSFKVGGKIKELLKKEGESVKKGELIALLDDKDYKVALKRIEKEIEALKLKKEELKTKKERIKKELDINENMSRNSILAFKKKINSLSHKVKSNKERLKKISLDEKRFKSLLKKKLISKDEYERVLTEKNSLLELIKSGEIEIKSLKKDLLNVKDKLKLAKIKKGLLNEIELNLKSIQKKIESLNYQKKDIENKISYCLLYSPIDGAVAKKFVNISKVVEKGYPIYSVVNPKDLHVEVLLSEKKLKGVKVGNSVKIKVDAYPNRKFSGKVLKIFPASAATFSLVPRDIASGEFTKLDQRFIVKISIDNPIDELRVGMGATVAIKRN